MSSAVSMHEGDDVPRARWAPRVPRHVVELLYQRDALGLRDEGLVDEVGMAFYARVESSLAVTDAHRGLIACWGCSGQIEHKMHQRRGTMIRCPRCGWSMVWESFHRSYRKKQLVAGGMEPFFRDFKERYPMARGYCEKMLLIDSLIHRLHGELAGSPGRSGAVNLIGGTWQEVLELLERLAHGTESTAGLAETRAAWRAKRAQGSGGRLD